MSAGIDIIRDLGHPDADRKQLSTLLAARIIGALNDRGRAMHARAGGGLSMPHKRHDKARPGTIFSRYHSRR